MAYHVDREGQVSRIGLTLNISHARLNDLRIKIIAPSGRAVEIETGLERASSNEEIRIPAAQLGALVGESLGGTWSISVRDESLGVAGQLVGWNLKLNAQGAVEDFQRGLNIPDPVERETDNVWFEESGRYAIARAMHSDSARIWDLAFAEPVRAIAVSENEKLIGLDAVARRLVTATQDGVNIWDTASGDRIMSLPVGAASTRAQLTKDGMHLIAEHRGDIETRLELWSLAQGEAVAELVVAGVPALVTTDPSGSRVAVADYDRAVRVWDFATGELLAQIDLPLQPSSIQLAAGGDALGVVHGQSGVSLWSISRPQRPLLGDFARGNWQLVFSPSGASVLAGRAETGFQTYRSVDGRLAGPPVGVRSAAGQRTMLAFSTDEKVIFTGNPQSLSRFWQASEVPAGADVVLSDTEHLPWQPSADRVTVALPGGKGLAIGDPAGHVHILPGGASLADVQALSDDVSFVGHTAEVVRLGVDPSGSLVASAAVDHTVRVWNTQSGQPQAWISHIPGDAVEDLVFSPDGTVLAVLKATSLDLLNVEDGSVAAEVELGEPHESVAFAPCHRAASTSYSLTTPVWPASSYWPKGGWAARFSSFRDPWRKSHSVTVVRGLTSGRRGGPTGSAWV